MYSHYDDFGVPPDASQEQIRDAYRILARLLHPDQQTDPMVKRAAEYHMMRVNHGYSVLSDPQLRRKYDAELQASRERPAPVVIRTPNPVLVRTQLPASSFLWIGAALLSLGVIYWLATQVQASQQRTTAISRDAPPQTDAPAQAPRVSPDPGYHRPEPNPPADNPVQQSALPAPPVRTTPAQPDVIPPPAPSEAPTFAMPQLPAPATTAIQMQFGGFWAYPHEKNFQHQSGRYPPQFIETSITEKEGVLRGKYRARYFVSDRPISPNVNFEFEGKPDGYSAKLPWHGEGGSQGFVEIKLLAGGQMEVQWHATDFGQVLGLASGTAVLVRRPD